MPTIEEELKVYLVSPIEGTHPAKLLRWAHISSAKNKSHTHIINDDWSYELKTQMASHMEQHHSKISPAHHSRTLKIGSNKIMEILLVALLVVWLYAIRKLTKSYY